MISRESEPLLTVMISIADVDQALAALADAKEAYFASGRDPALKPMFDAAKRDLVQTRRAYRILQEADGARVGFVGGDAAPQEG